MNWQNEKDGISNMTDYQAGYQAYFSGIEFDSARPQAWQEGWEDAEADDFDSGLDGEEFNFGYGE